MADTHKMLVAKAFKAIAWVAGDTSVQADTTLESLERLQMFVEELQMLVEERLEAVRGDIKEA